GGVHDSSPCTCDTMTAMVVTIGARVGNCLPAQGNSHPCMRQLPAREATVPLRRRLRTASARMRHNGRRQ
ncbi:unnamed protein product, partial [Musa textilis]